MGIILIDRNALESRWQSSDAVEEIGQLLPGGDLFVATYRALPGAKWLGARVDEQVRERRYDMFGKRDTYNSAYPVSCKASLSSNNV